MIPSILRRLMRLVATLDGDPAGICLLVTDRSTTNPRAPARTLDRRAGRLSPEQPVANILAMGRTFVDWDGPDEERRAIEDEARSALQASASAR